MAFKALANTTSVGCNPSVSASFACLIPWARGRRSDMVHSCVRLEPVLERFPHKIQVCRAF